MFTQYDLESCSYASHLQFWKGTRRLGGDGDGGGNAYAMPQYPLIAKLKQCSMYKHNVLGMNGNYRLERS